MPPNRGADIRTRTRAVETRQADGLWHVTVEDTLTGERSTIMARVLVNAAGPWVENVLRSAPASTPSAKVRLVQGTHIVVQKLYDHDRAYIFQNTDGRIVFAIPYEDDFTLIGTTDRDYDGDPAKVKATDEEIDYLCASVSEYFAKPVTPADVVWTYAGVRPLYDDGASEAKAATRDYVLELDAPGGAPLLSVFGGKITTYRRLAEEALEKLVALSEGHQSAQGLDRQSAAAGRRLRCVGGRGADGGTAARLSLPDAGACAPAGARLRHPRRQCAGRGEIAWPISGRGFGATLTESEVRYLMSQRMGAVPPRTSSGGDPSSGLRMSAGGGRGARRWLAARPGTDRTSADRNWRRAYDLALENVTRVVGRCDAFATYR